MRILPGPGIIVARGKCKLTQNQTLNVNSLQYVRLWFKSIIHEQGCPLYSQIFLVALLYIQVILFRILFSVFYTIDSLHKRKNFVIGKRGAVKLIIVMNVNALFVCATSTKIQHLGWFSRAARTNTQ